MNRPPSDIAIAICAELLEILTGYWVIEGGDPNRDRVPYLRDLAVTSYTVTEGPDLRRSSIDLVLEGEGGRAHVTIIGKTLEDAYRHPLLPDPKRSPVQNAAVDLSRAVYEFVDTTRRRRTRETEI
jgi:hypothetical protein